MKKDVLRGVKQYNASRKRRKNWQKVVMLMACVVVFCTTYALILPAITMEGQQCQIPEHTHTDECYTLKTTSTRQVLHCTYESLGVHQHTEDCYDDDGNLICGEEDFVAHTHDENCYDENGVLVCELPEIKPHTHDESCYTLPEPHVHDESCYQRERGALICTESTEASEEETMQLICELPEDENHTHGEECYEKVPAAQPHVHTDECYEWEDVLVCEKSTEPDPDAQPILTCEEPEIIPHTHTEDCYDKDGNRICGQVELLVHQHTASCFDQVEEPLDTTVLTCTLPEDENHTHTERCYGQWELTCGMEEHTHTLACYANPEADVETAENWEQTFASAIGSGDWRKDAAAIAKTQLGYTESKENYIVAEDGETVKGYTRYGAWFGQPYGDWNTLFASFCLHYAGAEITGQTCQDLITALGEYYVNPAEHAPQAGEPVFLDMDGDGSADQVGILTEITENAAETAEEAVEGETVEPQAAERTLTVVEGDLPGEMGDAVREERYPETFVVGYGAVPKATKPFTLTAQTEGGITVTVTGEDSSLPYPVEEITLTAVEVVDEESLAIRDELLEDKAANRERHILLNITLWHGEEEIEPIGPVQVIFGGLDDQGLHPVVHHIDTEKREATDMGATRDENGKIAIETDHFSDWDIMLLGVTPISGNDIWKISNGGSYQLTNTGSTESTIIISQNTTLDLNGQGIYYTGTGNLFQINNGGSLTILDSQAAQETITSGIGGDKYGQTAQLDFELGGNKPDKLTYYVTRSAANGAEGTDETLESHVVKPTGVIVAEAGATAIVNVNGGEFKLEGGFLANRPKDNRKCRIIESTNSGSVRISGGYIAGGDAPNDWGGGLFSNGGSVTMTGGVIAANKAKSGGGIALEGGTFEMSGGIISGNSVPSGTTGNFDAGYGGGVFAKDATTTISGDAYITNNKIPDHCAAVGAGCHGGGGVATQGGTLNIQGGYVTGNFSGEAGGGMYIGQWNRSATTFEMTGGTVASNVAGYSEGGGISIRGSESGADNGSKGTIKATPGTSLYITNNKTNTTIDWGGGGIFVQMNAHLDIQNALITDNDADGFGGGVGACPSGETLIVHEDGAAIYGNRIKGQQMSGGNNGKNEDAGIALGDYNAKYGGKPDEEKGYKDYFCVRTESHDKAISLVTGEMIGGGAANWFGSCDRNEITISKTGHVAADYLFGLTAKPSPEDKGKAQNAAQVIITGNSSGTHGGGIMTNGGLIIGNTHEDVVTSVPTLNIRGTKALVQDGEELASGRDFKFQLWNKDKTIMEDEVTSHPDTGTFTISPKVKYEKEGTYTYYLKENIDDGKSGISYDETQYKIEVDVKRHETMVVGIKFVSYSIEATRVWKITDGVETELGGSTGSGTGSSGNVVLHYSVPNKNPVYVYAWYEGGSKILGEWPGKQASKDLDGNWFYEMDGIGKNEEFMFIINGGMGSWQTGSLIKKSGYSEVWVNESGAIYKYEEGGDTPTPGGDFTGTSNPDGSYTLALNGDTFTNIKETYLNLKIVKTDSDNPSNHLSGAKFLLKEKGAATGVEETTNAIGEALFKGLKKDTTYYLWETQAPANYYKAGPWILEIDGKGAGTLFTAKDVNGVLEKTGEGTVLGPEGTDPIVLTANISDKPWGYELPATGGTGTTWYTLGGLLITVVAAGLLVYNKKSRRGGVAFL